MTEWTKEWGPAFQLYAAEFLVDIAMWPDRAGGLYCKLLFKEWVDGYLPNDLEQIRAMAVDHPDFDKNWEKFISKKFTTDGNGRLYNKRLELIRREQIQFKRNKANAGKASGYVRSHRTEYEQRENRTRTEVATESEQNPQQKRTLQSSSSSSSSSSISTSPSTSKEKDIDEVIEKFNEIVGTNYQTKTKSIRESIRARLDDGYSVENCIQVIRTKLRDWKGSDMEKYLRPSTLFRPGKFPEYLNQKSTGKKTMYDRHNEFVKEIEAENAVDVG